jgi:hypothetical protein
VTGDAFNLESVTLHHMTSDAFFAGNHCPQGIEFAFIDGLHHFDQVLTDLVNLEPFLAPNAVVALHDTLPRDARTSTRILTHDHWTGDVWKVVPILQDCRPEVEIYTIDTPPSGLTLLRHLGSAKRTPKSVIAEWMGDDFSSYQRPETHVKLPNWIA